MVHANLERMIDGALVLRPAASVALAAAGTSNEATIVDLGPGYHRFDVYFDVTTFSAGDTDDIAVLKIHGSNDSFVTLNIELASLRIGHATALGTSNGRGAGEYVLPCHNIGKDANNVDVVCRYIRMHWTVAGATVSLDWNAWAAKR